MPNKIIKRWERTQNQEITSLGKLIQNPVKWRCIEAPEIVFKNGAVKKLLSLSKHVLFVDKNG